MFDIIAGPRPATAHRSAMPLAISMTAHLLLVAAVAIPALYVMDELPELPTMMAFVAPVSVPPPPPPPPPPAVKAPEARQVATSARDAAPIEAPRTIEPESGLERAEEGVPGGVEGGISGGVVGGIVGGIVELPPAPPPLPPAFKTPVRVGGEIREPALLVRVPPVYPEIAVRAQLHGIVILEALVDEDGVVQDIKVLRSVKFFDKPAIDAVKQWRYSPLTLNGEAMPFVLTVSLSFKLDSAAAR